MTPSTGYGISLEMLGECRINTKQSIVNKKPYILLGK